MSKYFVFFGICALSSSIYSCKSESNNPNKIESEKSTKMIRIAMNSTSSSHIQSITTFAFHATIKCGNTFGDSSHYLESIEVTNISPNISVLKGFNCSLTFEKFHKGLDNISFEKEFLPLKQNSKLILNVTAEGIIQASTTSGHYTNGDLNKYINGSGQNDSLNLYVSNDPNTPTDIVTNPPITANNITSISINHLLPPESINLSTVKTVTKNFTAFTIFGSSRSWPKNILCKIVSPAISTSTPLLWNIVDTSFKNASSKNCSEIKLGNSGNWNAYHNEDVSIILANPSADGSQNAYRVIKVNKF